MGDETSKASSLRLDLDIREQVDEYAKKTRRSRNAAVNHLLEVALAAVENESDNGKAGS